MSILQRLLSPFVRDFWIGRTFVHQARHSEAPQLPSTPGLELRLLNDEDIDAIRHSSDSSLHRVSPLGPGLQCFGARLNESFVGVCTFAFGREYVRSGGFYGLGPSEAELADVFTSSFYRGRGIASALIQFSTEQMHQQGFETLFAKVWHSNTPSSRAFLRAGWKQSCFFIRLYPRFTARIWHTEWRCPNPASS